MKNGVQTIASNRDQDWPAMFAATLNLTRLTDSPGEVSRLTTLTRLPRFSPASHDRSRDRSPTGAARLRSAEAVFRSISANFSGDAPGPDTRSTRSPRCGPENRAVQVERSPLQIRARTWIRRP